MPGRKVDAAGKKLISFYDPHDKTQSIWKLGIFCSRL